MDELSKQPLEAFLAAVADATPAPGGGSSAAVAAALAAALVEMAAALPSSRGDGAPRVALLGLPVRPTRRARFARGH